MIIKDYIFRKNVIILICIKGITFIGSKEKMLDINIIEPIKTIDKKIVF